METAHDDQGLSPDFSGYGMLLMQANDFGPTLLADLLAIRRETMAVLREARATGANDLALKAIARLEKQIELTARLVGEQREVATVNIQVSKEWIDLRDALLKALEPHAAARSAVAEVLNGARG
jgi:hypothetical protein